MKSKLKRLALVLTSAVLFGLVLTSCGGGGGTGGNGGNGGNGGGGSIVTPGDDGTNYEASEDGTQVIETDENGEIVSVTNIEADELSGDRTLTRTYSILPEKVQLQGCVLVQETVTTNAEGHVIKVVRRYAIAVGELAKTNGTVALLAEIVLPDEKMDDTVYVTVTSEYEDGSLVKTTVEYEDEEGQLYKVQYDVGDDGDLELIGSGDDESVVAPILALLGDNEDVKQTVQDISEDAKDSADELIKNVDKALEEQGKTDPDPDPEPTPTPEVPTEKVYGVEDFKLTLKGEDQSRPDMAELYVSGEIVEAVTEGKIATEVTAQAELIYDEETGKLCRAEAEVPTEIVEAFPSAEGAVIIADFDCSEEGTVGITVHVEKNGAQVGESYSGSITHDGKHLTGAVLNLNNERTVLIEVEYNGDAVSAVSVKIPNGASIRADFDYTNNELTFITILAIYADGEQVVTNVNVVNDDNVISRIIVDMEDYLQGAVDLEHSGGVLTNVSATGTIQNEDAKATLSYDTAGAFEHLHIEADIDEKTVIDADGNGNVDITTYTKISEETTVEIQASVEGGNTEGGMFRINGVEVTDADAIVLDEVPSREVTLTVNDIGISYEVGDESRYVEWSGSDGYYYAYLEIDSGIFIDWDTNDTGELTLYESRDWATLTANEDGTWTLNTFARTIEAVKEYEESYGDGPQNALRIYAAGTGENGEAYRECIRSVMWSDKVEVFTEVIPQIIKVADMALPRISRILSNGFVLN